MTGRDADFLGIDSKGLYRYSFTHRCMWENCTDCPLHESRSRIVWGVGNTRARVLLLGEAPGRTEDEGGEPFIGRSGKVLDRCLDDIGKDRSDVYITNVVRCRPPRNRTPKVSEMKACREKMVWEIEKVSPEIIVTLGKTPAKAILGRDVKLKDEAGNMTSRILGDRTYEILLSYHPAACVYHIIEPERLRGILSRAFE